MDRELVAQIERARTEGDLDSGRCAFGVGIGNLLFQCCRVYLPYQIGSRVFVTVLIERVQAMRHRIQMHLGHARIRHALDNGSSAERIPRHGLRVGFLPLPLLEELLHLALGVFLREEAFHGSRLLTADDRSLNFNLVHNDVTVFVVYQIAAFVLLGLLGRDLLDECRRIVCGKFNRIGAFRLRTSAVHVREVVNHLVHLRLLVDRGIEIAGKHLIARHAIARHRRAFNRGFAIRVDGHVDVILVPADELIAVHRIGLKRYISLWALRGACGFHHRTTVAHAHAVRIVDVRIHAHVGLIAFGADDAVYRPQLHRALDERVFVNHLGRIRLIEHQVFSSISGLLLSPTHKRCIRHVERGSGRLTQRVSRMLFHHIRYAIVRVIRHIQLSIAVRLVVRHNHVMRASLDGIDERRVIVSYRRAAVRCRHARPVRRTDGVNDGALRALNRPGSKFVSRSRVDVHVRRKRKRHGAVVVANFRRRRVRWVSQRRIACDIGGSFVTIIRIHGIQLHGTFAQRLFRHQIRRDGIKTHLRHTRGFIVHRVVLDLRHGTVRNLALIDPP